MGIPIENIYYLLCYAWNKLDERDQVNISIDDKTTLVDLLAKVLISGTKILLKRGIDKSYINQSAELAGIKGKLMLTDTLKSGLHLQKRTWCSFDEYSSDTILNQILIGTLYRLMRIQKLDTELKYEAKQLVGMFPDVSQIEIRASDFRGLRFSRNVRFYAFLINVCQLIFESSLPSEKKGEWKFMDFTRDESKMNQLFEAFIRNFYQREQSVYKVRRESIYWQFEASEEAYGYLPQMQTDISLESETQKSIIDAKYYKETMSVYYDKEKVKSVNLYQVFSYLLNQRKGDAKTESAKAILIYPTIDAEYDLNYLFQKHMVCIRTLNLNCNWKAIHQRLMTIL